MVKKSALKKYAQKRDFTQTPEPRADHDIAQQERLLFVVQEHHARRLHYDFRIEVEGVLKSWAIPKGPSSDPSVKRLAIMTEDHPYDYAFFEGIIPPGNYGAGTVRIWDRGVYRPLRVENNHVMSFEECFREGLLELWLDGSRLKGGYALVRLDNVPGGYWLFIKMRDTRARRLSK
jgi:DNA ligase D-like protein (predicted 3'-phosphoesterase)